MKGYGSFCPIAKAAEILSERWTLLVLRDILVGSRRFNDLRRGVPQMSPMVFALALAATPASVAQAQRLAAPNVVEVSPQLVTSGQPSAEALASLKSQGFEAVIYLAPPTVSDAVRDERLIVTRQGLTFVNIPIRFDDPTEADFETFTSVLSGLGSRKVLVHCQINLRASAFVFLYRAIVLKDDPSLAYEAVSKVWLPEGPWRRLIESQLHKHKVAFDLF
jgi:protein tyrosine phosphatase (PTP) superfamily phosphohydrolase (DUF442 family)